MDELVRLNRICGAASLAIILLAASHPAIGQSTDQEESAPAADRAGSGAAGEPATQTCRMLRSQSGFKTAISCRFPTRVIQFRRVRRR